MPDHPGFYTLNHVGVDSDELARRWTLCQGNKPASLISLEEQLLAAKQLLEEHGFRVVPVKSLERWMPPTQVSETPNAH